LFGVMKRRLKVSGDREGVYHCMTRTVNGERLFGDREKEVLRRMIWQVSDFCGVEVLTYAVMSNHFHVLVRVPYEGSRRVPDEELMRRYRVLYPKPTKHRPESAEVVERTLRAGGAAPSAGSGQAPSAGSGQGEAEALRAGLLARMGDVSEFMKTLKQRFSVWFNRKHDRFGTLWSERFKSVLVEGEGNPLQTMAAYIDLNAVRAGLVGDPKDYRYCGYGEAVAGHARAGEGLRRVWSDWLGRDGSGGVPCTPDAMAEALRAHRRLLFAKGANDESIGREAAVRVLEKEDARLPKAVVLRCRVRYFTEGAILGSRAFVEAFAETWQRERGRKRKPAPKAMRGADWGDLTTIRGLRSGLFG